MRGPYRKSKLGEACKETYGSAYSSSLAVSLGTLIKPIRAAGFWNKLVPLLKQAEDKPGVYEYAGGSLRKVGEWIASYNLVKGVKWND